MKSQKTEAELRGLWPFTQKANCCNPQNFIATRSPSATSKEMHGFGLARFKIARFAGMPRILLWEPSVPARSRSSPPQVVTTQLVDGPATHQLHVPFDFGTEILQGPFDASLTRGRQGNVGE